MSRRIDIELTSDRGDGTWTWRAAGAKQPKGVVDGGLLPSDAAVGRQLRADVETTLDGTDVLSVSGPKAKNRAAVETIDLLPRGGDEPLVTQTLVGRRGGGDRGDRRDRGERGDRGPRGPRDNDRSGRGGGGDRGRGREGERTGGPRDRPAGARRGPGGGRSEGAGDGHSGAERDRGRSDRPSAPLAKPKAKRLRAGRAHRKTALDLLSPEEQVVAELLLSGGVPAVRQAIETQNAQAKAEETREVSAAPVLVIAERLWPRLRLADWRDKAEAALTDLTELDLRDLRSVVVTAESVAKDDDTRELATQLRDGLTRRLEGEQAAWLEELGETLREGRVVRALRLSSRPPKAGAPLPPDLAGRLAEATSAALTADTLPDRWATVLDALSFSPARLTVVPASKPDEPAPELLATITRMADRVPKVAEAFGVDPTAASPRRRNRGGRPQGGRGAARPGAGGPRAGAAKRPPPPPPPQPQPQPQPTSADAPTTPDDANPAAGPRPTSDDLGAGTLADVGDEAKGVVELDDGGAPGEKPT